MTDVEKSACVVCCSHPWCSYSREEKSSRYQGMVKLESLAADCGAFLINFINRLILPLRKNSHEKSRTYVRTKPQQRQEIQSRCFRKKRAVCSDCDAWHGSQETEN